MRENQSCSYAAAALHLMLRKTTIYQITGMITKAKFI